MNKKELIPFIQINDGPREIAVAWVENYRPYNSSQPEIAQKHKLASDIQNYAIEFADQKKQALMDKIKERIKDCYPHPSGFADNLIDAIFREEL